MRYACFFCCVRARRGVASARDALRVNRARMRCEVGGARDIWHHSRGGVAPGRREWWHARAGLVVWNVTARGAGRCARSRGRGGGARADGVHGVGLAARSRDDAG